MKLFRQKDELFELMGKGRRAGPTPTPHPTTAGPPLAVRASSVAGKITNATTGPTGTQRLGTRTTEPTPAPETPATDTPAPTPPAPAPAPAPAQKPTISAFTGPTGVTSGLPALSNPPRLPQRLPPSIKPPTTQTTTTTRRRSLSPSLPAVPGTDSDLFDIDGDALVVVDDGWNEATAAEGPERTFAIRADTAIVGGLLASGLLLTAFLVGRTTTTPEAPDERPIATVTLVQPTIDPANATSLPASVSNASAETASALTAGAPTAPPATTGNATSSAPQAGFQPPTTAATPGKFELRVVTTTPEKAKALAAWLNGAPRSPIFGRGDLQVVVNGGSVKIQGFMQREPEVFSRVRATSDPTGGSGTFHDAYFAAVKVANSP